MNIVAFFLTDHGHDVINWVMLHSITICWDGYQLYIHELLNFRGYRHCPIFSVKVNERHNLRVLICIGKSSLQKELQDACWEIVNMCLGISIFTHLHFLSKQTSRYCRVLYLCLARIPKCSFMSRYLCYYDLYTIKGIENHLMSQKAIENYKLRTLSPYLGLYIEAHKAIKGLIARPKSTEVTILLISNDITSSLLSGHVGLTSCMTFLISWHNIQYNVHQAD